MSITIETNGRTTYYGNEVRPLVTRTHTTRGDIVEIDIRKPEEERLARAEFFKAIDQATRMSGADLDIEMALLRSELVSAEKHGFKTLIILAPKGYPPTMQLSKTRMVPYDWSMFDDEA